MIMSVQNQTNASQLINFYIQKTTESVRISKLDDKMAKKGDMNLVWMDYPIVTQEDKELQLFS